MPPATRLTATRKCCRWAAKRSRQAKATVDEQARVVGEISELGGDRDSHAGRQHGKWGEAGGRPVERAPERWAPARPRFRPPAPAGSALERAGGSRSRVEQQAERNFAFKFGRVPRRARDSREARPGARARPAAVTCRCPPRRRVPAATPPRPQRAPTHHQTRPGQRAGPKSEGGSLSPPAAHRSPCRRAYRPKAAPLGASPPRRALLSAQGSFGDARAEVG
jgi:hypothetical protein